MADFFDELQEQLDAMRVSTLVDALRIIADRGCENYPDGGACHQTARQPDRQDPSKRWCPSCVAHRALHGGDAIRYADGRVLKPGAVSFD